MTDPSAPPPPPVGRRLVDWCFRDRETGRLVVAQAPNLPLGLFLVTALGRRALQPSGPVDTVLSATSAVALAWWALDELVRGVNPWRRFLGGAVAAGMVVGRLRA